MTTTFGTFKSGVSIFSQDLFLIPRYERELANGYREEFTEHKAPKDNTAVALHEWLTTMRNLYGDGITIEYSDYDGIFAVSYREIPLTDEEIAHRQKAIADYDLKRPERNGKAKIKVRQPFKVNVDNLTKS